MAIVLSPFPTGAARYCSEPASKILLEASDAQLAATTFQDIVRSERRDPSDAELSLYFKAENDRYNRLSAYYMSMCSPGDVIQIPEQFLNIVAKHCDFSKSIFQNHTTIICVFAR